ncbi:MAG: alkaline phosphatase family protein [Opitutales bacterium]|nr:alkaline phosphatase family protein [Opitutales bacterium]
MKTLGLFVFIDALGWEVLRRHPDFLADLAPHRQPLETILGYSSACDPSIISGLTPAEHKLWSSYYYLREGPSPFAWTRSLGLLPERLTERARVRHYLSKLVKRVCRITGYFQLYNVPFRHLPLFHYAEWKRIWEIQPEGLPVGTTIFDLMHAAGLSWYVHDSGKNDEGKLADLKTALESGKIDLAYISLGKLDALMHAEGTQTPKVGDLLRWYDVRIHEIMTCARAHYGDVRLHVFTDHGMHDIHEGYDLQEDMAALGLRFGRDYVAFYDSTMGRFWPLTEDARKSLHAALDHHPKGRLLPEEELRRLGVFFPDGQYGDLIFLMNPGIQIAPGFMGRKAIPGMHGFHPDEPDSRAMICANHPLPPDLRRIEQIFGLMCASTGITPPRGRAVPPSLFAP